MKRDILWSYVDESPLYLFIFLFLDSLEYSWKKYVNLQFLNSPQYILDHKSLSAVVILRWFLDAGALILEFLSMFHSFSLEFFNLFCDHLFQFLNSLQFVLDNKSLMLLCSWDGG